MSWQPLTGNDLHQLRLAANHGWPVDRYPVGRYFATLDPIWFERDEIKAEVGRVKKERDEARSLISDMANGLLAYGWVVADPWDAHWQDPNCMQIVDSGPMCPVCGTAAPKGEKWPPGITMYDPANHAEDCALAEYLRSLPAAAEASP